MSNVRTKIRYAWVVQRRRWLQNIRCFFGFHHQIPIGVWKHEHGEDRQMICDGCGKIGAFHSIHGIMRTVDGVHIPTCCCHNPDCKIVVYNGVKP